VEFEGSSMHVYVISLFAFYLSFIVSLSIPRGCGPTCTILKQTNQNSKAIKRFKRIKSRKPNARSKQSAQSYFLANLSVQTEISNAPYRNGKILNKRFEILIASFTAKTGKANR
jgi:hypothetical protein